MDSKKTQMKHKSKIAPKSAKASPRWMHWAIRLALLGMVIAIVVVIVNALKGDDDDAPPEDTGNVFTNNLVLFSILGVVVLGGIIYGMFWFMRGTPEESDTKQDGQGNGNTIKDQDGDDADTKKDNDDKGENPDSPTVTTATPVD
mmetsp:Transcript_8885/g.16338  ORF Transcript_8885/g.16338 Transcript_8885/m.16338 type:complete len:145 (-) Transcript_8885:166-600(-)